MTATSGTPSTDAQPPAFPMERTCPYQMPPGYERLGESGPLSRVTLYDGRQVWLVSANAEGRALLLDPRLSSSVQHPAFPHLSQRMATQQQYEFPLIGVDDPEHARQRKLLTSGFGVRRIAALRPRIERTAEELIDTMLAQGDEADLVRAYTQPLASAAIFALLGVPHEDHRYVDERSRVALSPSDGEEAQSPEQAFHELLGYLRDLLVQRDRTPDKGVIDDLIASRRAQGELDLDEMMMICAVLLIGGNETTSTSIATSVLALLEHPDQLERLRADSSLTAGAVEELTRLISVTDVVSRVAVADIPIAGQTIKSGDGVLISTMLMNRDPSAWQNPADLDILRKAGRHVAFGYGIHQCVGQNLARAVMEIALTTLLRRVPALRLAVPSDQVRRTTPFAQLGGVAELPIAW